MSEKIERLEDIVSKTMINYLETLARYQSPVTTLDFEVAHAFSRKTTMALYRRNLVDNVGNLELTPRGAALVADYQRRQMAQRETNMIAREIERIAREDALEQSDWQSSPEHTNQGAVSLKDFDGNDYVPHEDVILELYGYTQANGHTTSLEDENLSLEAMQSLLDAYRAEVAQLREENATLTARNQEQGRDLTAALKRIEQLKDIVAGK